MNSLQPLLIPIGAVTAAIIAGLFSYLALIISKEQKTSEFRQAWIDALREEVADFIGSVRIIRYTISNLRNKHAGKVPPQEQIDAICEPYEKASIAYNRILLRLNPENSTSAAVIAALAVVGDAMKAIDFEKAVNELRPVRESARVVLKEEWERVKRGERVFLWSKRILGVLIFAGIVGLAMVVYSSVKNGPSNRLSNAASPAAFEKKVNETPVPPPTSVTSPATQGPRQP